MLSEILRSSSCFSSCPTMPSCSTMPSAWIPLPVLPSDSGLRWVKTCMRVVLNQTKNGLFALALVSMNFIVASRNSPSIVGMRLTFSGPVSSIRCVPSGLAQE